MEGEPGEEVEVRRAGDRKPFRGLWHAARVLEGDAAGRRVRVRYHHRPDVGEEWVPLDAETVRPAPEGEGGVLDDGAAADADAEFPPPELPEPVRPPARPPARSQAR